MAERDDQDDARSKRPWLSGGSLVLFAAGLVAAVLLGVLVLGGGGALGAVSDAWADWTSSLQQTATELPELRIDEQRALDSSGSVLIVVTDEGGRATSLVLLADGPEGETTLALIPPGLFDVLPGYGDFSLADATLFEGPELAALGVSNSLGVRIDRTISFAPGELALVLPDPVSVDLPSALEVAEPNGTRTIVVSNGEGEVDAVQIEVLLTTRGEGSQLDWLQRQAAVWDGIMEAAGRDADIADGFGAKAGAGAETVTGLVAAAGAGEPQITIVPVTRVAVSGAEDAFSLDADQARAFIDRRLAHLKLVEGERSRVEILNGNGRVLTTRSVAETLVRRGFHIIRTDNADSFDYEGTLVVSQGRDNRREAERALNALGIGELLLELRAPSGVVDISIIVGHDIPAGEG